MTVLVTGGAGMPAGLDHGYFVKPTVFTNVTNNMEIAREEIFGPVVNIRPFSSLDDAIDEINATP